MKRKDLHAPDIKDQRSHRISLTGHFHFPTLELFYYRIHIDLIGYIGYISNHTMRFFTFIPAKIVIIIIIIKGCFCISRM